MAGSKPALALLETLENRFDIEVGLAWGMTEAQMGSMPVLKKEYENLPRSEKIIKKHRGGVVNFGVKMRLLDDDGKDVPFDGKASGHLIVKGPWVLSRYLNHSDTDRAGYLAEDGWLKTGDVACIHPDGYLEIVDRSKDLIKSGGEWIGPAIIESIISSHPDISEAAVIGIPHPKWDERPLLLVVKKSASGIDGEALRSYLKGKVASWWIPEEVVFIDELPKTGTGKVNKSELKAKFLKNDI